MRKIDLVGEQEGVRPIVFSTLVQEDVRNVVRGSTRFLSRFFRSVPRAPRDSSSRRNRATSPATDHRMADAHAYAMRIDATNFALANDDGSVVRDYERADLILLGVSRSGKTPTCLYLAMQYGIFAANYPLTEDDLESRKMPRALEALRAEAVRPDDQARSAATNPQRAPPGQPLFLAAAGCVRGARRGVAVRAPRHSRASTRPSVRSRKCQAEFSTARASSGACVPDNCDAAWYSRTMLADQLCQTSWRAQPGSFVSLMTLYESNFVRLGWLVRDLRAVTAPRGVERRRGL